MTALSFNCDPPDLGENWTANFDRVNQIRMTDDFTQNQTFDVPDGYELLPWHRGFGRQVGPLFERRDENGLLRGFRVEEHHTNGMGNAHGGMLMTFADMAWGGAVESDEDTWWVTVRLLVDFLSSAPVGAFVEGKGEVIGEVDGVITVEGKIWSGEKTLLRGTGIFKIIERRDGAGDASRGDGS